LQKLQREGKKQEKELKKQTIEEMAVSNLKSFNAILMLKGIIYSILLLLKKQSIFLTTSTFLEEPKFVWCFPSLVELGLS
jgi:hypothetical protein